ncbi:hypothetical protein HanPI659440_Chr00c02g0708131 [Helianthus annuus]|nr:hypothetical protein HanPI659440_Chr00c02g0708131 [Helianthus annuus]
MLKTSAPPTSPPLLLLRPVFRRPPVLQPPLLQFSVSYLMMMSLLEKRYRCWGWSLTVTYFQFMQTVSTYKNKQSYIFSLQSFRPHLLLQT